MAVVGEIPIPKMGYETFNEGLANSQSIFNSLVNNRRINALLPGEIQAQDDAHLLSPYTRKLTAAQAQNLIATANRTNQLLPGEIVAQNDTHSFAAPQKAFIQSEADKNNESVTQSKTHRHFDLLRAGFDDYGNPLPAAQAPAIPSPQIQQAPQQPNAFQSMINGGSAQPQMSLPSPLDATQNISALGNSSGSFPNTSVPNAMEQYPALAQKIMGMQNNNQAPLNPNDPLSTVTNPAMPTNQALRTDQGTQQIQPNNNDTSSKKINPIVELQSARPGEAYKDRVAGSSFLGEKAPDVKTEYKDGMLITQYPSGRVTAQQAGPTLDERQASLLNRQNAYNESKQNMTIYNKLNDTALANFSLAKEARRGLAILEKNHNSTGLLKGALAKIHLSEDPDTAALNTIFGNIQSGTALQADPRGAVGALRWAGIVKPSTYNGHAYNVAQLKEVLKVSKEKYDEANRQALQVIGKPLRVQYGGEKELYYNLKTKKFEER